MKTTRPNKLGCAAALSAALSLALTGCATIRRHVDSGNVINDRPAAASVDATADFAWDVSGDNAIRPQQVFTLSGKTYLQMRAGQVIPAVVVGGMPVPFTISAPYIVVQGTPERMDLLSSGYRAVIVHRGPVTMPRSPVIAPDRVERITSNGASASSADGLAPAAGGATTIAAYTTQATPVPTRDIPHAQIDVQAVAPAKVAAAKTASERVWRIDPDQRLLSRALADWSREAGIKLVWKTKVDVPITGAKEYHDKTFLMALSGVLADASGHGYRFYFSMPDSQTITVVALSAS